jgi:hypothetical protein
MSSNPFPDSSNKTPSKPKQKANTKNTKRQKDWNQNVRQVLSMVDHDAAVAAVAADDAGADDTPLYLDPAWAEEMVPIYPVTFGVVGVVLVLWNAAVVEAGEHDVAAVVVGAAAAAAAVGVEERVEVVVAEERREDTVADNSVPDLTELLVNAEEDIGSYWAVGVVDLRIQQVASYKQHLV